MIVCVMWSCTACAEHGEPNHHEGDEEGHEVSARATQIATLKGDAQAGATLFESSCQSCHGADGEGGVYDFSLVQSAQVHGDDELAQSVITGLGDMPAYGDMYDDQQIADLLAHINTL